MAAAFCGALLCQRDVALELLIAMTPEVVANKSLLRLSRSTAFMASHAYNAPPLEGSE